MNGVIINKDDNYCKFKIANSKLKRSSYYLKESYTNRKKGQKYDDVRKIHSSSNFKNQNLL